MFRTNTRALTLILSTFLTYHESHIGYDLDSTDTNVWDSLSQSGVDTLSDVIRIDYVISVVTLLLFKYFPSSTLHARGIVSNVTRSLSTLRTCDRFSIVATFTAFVVPGVFDFHSLLGVGMYFSLYECLLSLITAARQFCHPTVLCRTSSSFSKLRHNYCHCFSKSDFK